MAAAAENSRFGPVSVHSIDVPVQNPNFYDPDNEMLSWLHLPAEEGLLDKPGYYTDWSIGDVNVQIVKHSVGQIDLSHKDEEAGGGSVDADNCSRDTGKIRDGEDAMNGPLSLRHDPDNSQPSPQEPDMGYGRIHQSMWHSPSARPRNFALFSSPVAEAKAGLHMVGTGSGPTSIERARQHLAHVSNNDLCLPRDPSGAGKSKDMPLPLQQASPSLPSSGMVSPHGYMNDGMLGKGNDARVGDFSLHAPDVVMISNSNNIDRNNNDYNHREDSATITTTIITSNNSNNNGKNENVMDPMNEQIASPSRASGGSSLERCNPDPNVHRPSLQKQKSARIDDSECQSEDVDNLVDNKKKPAKRVRAAEMHNLCERKRRDKINEKMMALRELMPNSSKTAKASILDEAIEYVKLLQSQLQVWSARTGIGIPPGMMPNSNSMHHTQRVPVPHTNFGMGTGIRMTPMDVNLATPAPGCTLVPILPISPQQSIGQSRIPQPGVSPHNAADHQYHPHLQMDPYRFYIPQSLVQPMPVNMDVQRSMAFYNAYAQGQQQQQLQHQWHLPQPPPSQPPPQTNGTS